MNRSVLKPGSYDEMFKEVKTKDGKGTHYGLGLSVSSRDGHLRIGHDGEVSGFVSSNSLIPDAKSVFVVLTNEDAVNAAGIIGRSIEPLLIGRSKEEANAFAIFTGLQNGRLDRALFTEPCNAYFSQQAIED